MDNKIIRKTNLRFEELMMSWVHAGHVMSLLHECALIPPEPEPEHRDSDCLSELLQGESAHLDPAKPADNLRKEKKRLRLPASL